MRLEPLFIRRYVFIMHVRICFFNMLFSLPSSPEIFSVSILFGWGFVGRWLFYLHKDLLLASWNAETKPLIHKNVENFQFLQNISLNQWNNSWILRLDCCYKHYWWIPYLFKPRFLKTAVLSKVMLCEMEFSTWFG